MEHVILKASAHKRMPWKNGKGETVEIAVHPAGASVDDFGWRISMANVPDSGAFSMFADIDRTLAVLSGKMCLSVDGMAPVTMGVGSPAVNFPGDSPTHADIVQSVLDLNVLVRRGQFEAKATRLETTTVEPGRRARFVVFGAAARLAGGTQLTPGDVLQLADGMALALDARCDNAWLVEIKTI